MSKIDSSTEQIKKLPNTKKQEIKKLPIEEQKNIEGLIRAIEYSGLEEFVTYIRSPWKMLWPNFVAGIARGIGTLIGAAVVIAIIGWFLSTLIDLPLIGQRLEPYVKEVQSEITKYTEATNYKENFDRMEQLLREMRDEIRTQKNLQK